MPISEGAATLIRTNLERIQDGRRAQLVVIGTLSTAQLEAINNERRARNHPPIVADVVFFGGHIYKSRIVRDGYAIEDVIDQIQSALSKAAIVILSPKMTAMENPNPRADRYGNNVLDRAVFECSARYPRAELFSVVPKGDYKKPKGPLTQ